MKKSFLIVMVLVVIAAVVAACTRQTPEPTSTSAPSPTPPPAETQLAIGIKSGESFHEIHTIKLQIKCESCHVKMTESYYDPLAQVSNLADKRACLSCHKEESPQPFYGEDWDQAKVR